MGAVPNSKESLFSVETLRKHVLRLPPPLQSLVLSGIIGFGASPGGQMLGLLLDLNRRLEGPHPSRLNGQVVAQESLSPDVLDAVRYDEFIDAEGRGTEGLLKGLQENARQTTGKGYVVIGGSGFVGTHIVRLLLLRKEPHIRILDLHPPTDQALANHPSVSFVKSDVTQLSSVRSGLLTPFKDGNKTELLPSVIFHTAAIIRFWERASYAYPLSADVNVRGTYNVITIASELASLNSSRSDAAETILVYTSTSDLSIPRPRFLKLGKDFEEWPSNTVVVSDEDRQWTEDEVKAYGSVSCYARSKREAEKFVKGANELDGGMLRTGILRPGQTIIGPNDRLVTSVLSTDPVTIFDKNWAHTNVCVWDAAAAHLALEDALRSRPEEAGGETFLITGNGSAWTMGDTRDAVKHYCPRPLTFKHTSPLLIFVLAHLIEVFLYLRFYFLFPFYRILGLLGFFSGPGSRPSTAPKWLKETVFLQPTTLEYMRDVVIDDSKARKMIGYRPLWETAQIIKYAVDQVESGRVRRGSVSEW